MLYSIKVFTTLSLLKHIECYFVAPMASFPIMMYRNKTQKVDECSSLYWYPRPVPEGCFRDEEYNKPIPPAPLPIPVPLPMPFPMPVPLGIPIVPPGPMLPVAQMPPRPSFMHMVPGPALRSPQAEEYPQKVPYALPPVAPYPAQVYPPFNPFVPRGGFIPPNGPPGGVHILPQNDVYSNLLKRIRQRKARRRLAKLIEDLDA